jgi:TolB-like protein/Tfp pilus assembly protein PilF
MTGPSKAVFLSYASQDAAAAQRLCDALRAAGIEVWFDQSHLRGGDAWDQKIRREIRDCALFIPVISANTAARPEGYFRLEWSLAEVRSQMIARNKAFIVPVCIDRTPESGADVPEAFQRVQWTRLPDGDTSPAFVAQIAALLGEPAPVSFATTEPVAPRAVAHAPTAKPAPRARFTFIVLVAVVVVSLAYVALDRFQSSVRTAPEQHVAGVAPALATPAILEKSVAVLPFIDMSEKKDQEYFSDGLSEELIGLLSKVPDLKVPGRTSSFYFKGKRTTIAEIAKTLGVAHVLEGSVRRSGNTLRVTAQLVRADNGYDMWSETYDRKLDDIFKVQDEISAAVVKALKIALLADTMPKTKPTANREAYALFLLSRSFHYRETYADVQKAIDYAEQAVKLDPSFAPAWAALGDSLVYGFSYGGSYAQIRARAYSAAKMALSLDPRLSDAHVAMGRVLGELDWDWRAADTQLRTAIALEPTNVLALAIASGYALAQGRRDEALRLAQKAIEIDPLSRDALGNLGDAAYADGRYADAETAYREAIDVNTAGSGSHLSLGIALLAQGQPVAALEVMQKETDEGFREYGLALAYQAAGRRADADQALAVLESRYPGSHAEQIASLYACRREPDKSFAWFDRAYQQRDIALVSIKNDPCFKMLQGDRRSEALLKKLNLS